MTNIKPDPDSDRGHDADHDISDGARAVAPTPAEGALISLAALATALNAVDTSTVAGRSGLPMLQFKRDGDGTWSYGQKRTVVEDGSRWAVNPVSFKWGYISFTNDNKVAAEKLISVSQPKPEVGELPKGGGA